MHTHSDFKTRSTEHRCPGCGLLLAVEREGRLHVRIKERCQFIVRGGAMTAVCRRCGEMIDIAADSEQARVNG